MLITPIKAMKPFMTQILHSMFKINTLDIKTGKNWTDISMNDTLFCIETKHAITAARSFGGPIKTKEKCISCTTAEPHCK